VLALAGVPGLFCPFCPFFMFGQLWVAFGEAEGEGVAASSDTDLTDVVPVVVDVVDDVVVAEWLVVALATAMLAPNPTPSAPAPTAVPIMILPSRDLKCVRLLAVG
jgi:hypothetical protein